MSEPESAKGQGRSEPRSAPSEQPDPGGRHEGPVLRRVIYSRGSVESQRAPLPSRERLIEAGWAASDDLQLPKAFAGVTTASVAERAGLTTGSFFHHFKNAAEFSDAMALAFVQKGLQQGDPSGELGEEGNFVDLVELIRSALTQTWINGTTDPVNQARFRCEMRLWTFHHVPLSEPTDSYTTVGEILRDSYKASERRSSKSWNNALARSGRQLLDPYNMAKVATAITALYEGLLLRSAVDPEAVDPNLFADVSAAIVNSLTGPAGMTATFDDTSVQLKGWEVRSPQAKSGARRRQENWTRIVSAASGMFGGGWENVSATEIADRAGMSAQTVLNLFHSVQRVAAATFVTHANEMYEFALSGSVEEPLDGLRATLTALSQRTGVAPEAARALLAERIKASVERGNSMSDLDIRIEVPIGGAIALWISRLGIGGDRGTDISAILANFVLGATLSGGLETPEIVEAAIRLLPEEIRPAARVAESERLGPPAALELD
ncbi:MAG: TetR/AcrR family transcriptional regulator [Microthrixaceae bacterium]